MAGRGRKETDFVKYYCTPRSNPTLPEAPRRYLSRKRFFIFGGETCMKISIGHKLVLLMQLPIISDKTHVWSAHVDKYFSILITKRSVIDGVAGIHLLHATPPTERIMTFADLILSFKLDWLKEIANGIVRKVSILGRARRHEIFFRVDLSWLAIQQIACTQNTACTQPHQEFKH